MVINPAMDSADLCIHFNPGRAAHNVLLEFLNVVPEALESVFNALFELRERPFPKSREHGHADQQENGELPRREGGFQRIHLSLPPT